MFLQPTASLFMGEGWERQPTELRSIPQPPEADRLTFNQSPAHPRFYTPLPSSPPHTVSVETDILEME